MHFKKFLSILVLGGILLHASDNSSLLSTLKQQKLDLDQQKNELESDNLKYDWVSQIIGAYSYTNSDQFGSTKETKLFSLKYDQPIFKSGGIYYGILYSGANREFLRLAVKLNRQELIKNIIATLLEIKKLDLQIQKQNILIANASIDITRKKEQYESGFLDSSFLDNAILSKNNAEKALIDMQANRYSLLMKFGSLSDADYQSLTPPVFSMVQKDTFLDKSLLLLQQDVGTKKAELLKKMTIANYLPTLSFFAGYYDSTEEFKNINSDSNYRNFGLRISMPLMDVNRGRTIEVKQIDYLKSKLELADSTREQENLYADYVARIDFLRQKVALSQKDAALYDSLLSSTRESFSAGEKTIYDVQTIENSGKTMLLDKAIYELDIQSALLELYAKMSGEI